MKYKSQDRFWRHLLSAPFIYGMIVPAIFLDITLEIYHRICFKLYGISYVSRKNYILMDRHRLAYLPWYDKIHCAYCGYVNGLFAYAVAIAGETEKYWCGIKHKPTKGFAEPAHHKEFMNYGDKEAFEKCKLNVKRKSSKKRAI
jgi:hypothetical protein